MNFPERIILIGFRCSGKTTLGKLLSKRLNWHFIDMDEEIQKREGKTIREIVEEKGWEYFRKLEKDYMRTLLNFKQAVLSLGGGAVLHHEELEKLKKRSFTVWLKASLSEILNRMKVDHKTTEQRPSLTNLSLEEELEKILKEREPLYHRFSDISIDTDNKNLEMIVEEIIREFKSFKEVQDESRKNHRWTS